MNYSRVINGLLLEQICVAFLSWPGPSPGVGVDSVADRKWGTTTKSAARPVPRQTPSFGSRQHDV